MFGAFSFEEAFVSWLVVIGVCRGEIMRGEIGFLTSRVNQVPILV